MKITFSGVVAGLALGFVCFLGASRMTVDSFVSGATTSRSDILLKEIRHTLALKEALDVNDIGLAHDIIKSQLVADLDELKGYRPYASDIRKQEIDEAFVNLAAYRQQLDASEATAVAKASWRATDVEAILGPVERALVKSQQAKSKAAKDTQE
ncbi:hypothetical protein [Echinimonas agarilytica]|uniref:Uncharacterized protein n=1 Tax=Echinimonas agarilytica TaxID=1215918 RepID=A0AA41W4M2_9GAMM|nr:hypothetical protein [Echinimonas agarilytica]MCM2678765.1 hypothetical protein [Echinimonas agarilytica]